ncbi:hypothetical protein HBI51_236740 [Parastagonospora nodorum]|nr:hypothetical protein HBI51_236740 [Parastagonospora nodorum]
MLLCWTIKLLSISSADKYSKKHLEVCEVDALKQVDANVRERGNKNCSSLYYSDSNNSLLDSNDYCLDSSSDINPKDNLEDEEATTAKDLAREQKERLKALLNAKMRDSLSARNKRIIKLLARAYILYFKELLSNNSRIFASNTFTLRTRRKCEMPKQKIAIDSANSTLCDLSNLLVVRFCIFSDSALENIGIPTNKEVVEMQTNTATALADKLATVNKLIIAEANMPAMHPKATKHCLALVTAYFIRIFESITKDTNRKHRLCPERSSAVDKVIGKHTYKTYNRVYALTAKTLSL